MLYTLSIRPYIGRRSQSYGPTKTEIQSRPRESTQAGASGDPAVLPSPSLISPNILLSLQVQGLVS